MAPKSGEGPQKREKERKSCIESGVWGRLGVLPQKFFFTEIGSKFDNSSHFYTRRMTYTSAATTRG